MYMLAGPNGAGKSTLYETRIEPRMPAVDAPFVNADIIQRDELKDASMQASYKAAEIADARRHDYLAAGRSFVSESTFSHESKLALIDDAKAAGYRGVMYHVSVRTADLSVARVAQRKLEGGHDVPEHKVRERFARNQELIKRAVLLADHAFVYDNSVLNRAPDLGLTFKYGKVIQVSERVPAWMRNLYAKELEKFRV
jgi:predicted ABC-type ATPase